MQQNFSDEKFNIYIDGTWLYTICKPNGVLARKTESKSCSFPFDFNGFAKSIGKHISSHTNHFIGRGTSIIAISNFELADDFDEWYKLHEGIEQNWLRALRQKVNDRSDFIRRAELAGYKVRLHKPVLSPYLVRSVINNNYTEKQVDQMLSLSLLENTIARPNEYHVLVSGDADFVPTLDTIYSNYSSNIFVAITDPHPHYGIPRTTSKMLGTCLPYKIAPYVLENNLTRLMEGRYVYRCHTCRDVFRRLAPIRSQFMPRCSSCLSGQRIAA